MKQGRRLAPLDERPRRCRALAHQSSHSILCRRSRAGLHHQGRPRPTLAGRGARRRRRCLRRRRGAFAQRSLASVRCRPTARPCDPAPEKWTGMRPSPLYWPPRGEAHLLHPKTAIVVGGVGRDAGADAVVLCPMVAEQARNPDEVLPGLPGERLSITHMYQRISERQGCGYYSASMALASESPTKTMRLPRSASRKAAGSKRGSSQLRGSKSARARRASPHACQYDLKARSSHRPTPEGSPCRGDLLVN